jgi:hypothetical protein
MDLDEIIIQIKAIIKVLLFREYRMGLVGLLMLMVIFTKAKLSMEGQTDKDFIKINRSAIVVNLKITRNMEKVFKRAINHILREIFHMIRK